MNKPINRRDFLKAGSAVAAGTILMPSILQGCVSPKGIASPQSYNTSDYLNHFGVTQAMIMEVIATGLSRGGDYCDLYFQHSQSNTVSLEDNLVNNARSNVSLGVGIRVLNGDQTGYSFTEDLSLTSMKSAALTAASIANTRAKVAPVALVERTLPNHYKINKTWEEVSINSKIPLLQRINEKTFALDNRIIKTSILFSDDTSVILFANSEGILAGDYQPMTVLRASCVAQQNGRREENSYNVSAREDIDFYTPAKLDKIAHEAVRSTVLLFDAIQPVAGEMPVVLAAGSSGILLHEAIGHGIEADFNRKGESIFSDKMGKKVAESFVTIVDDGTIPHNRGSINMDDEGNASQTTYMVENGILTSYLHDRISAKYYGVKPTGNGRRESFHYMPMPRMRNTYMLNGPHKKEEIIESVKYGIIAETFTGGQVKIGPGDFTFFVKQGYLIENGKITSPIKDINIIGNGPQVLKDIVMVADDLAMSYGGWTCGKNGQGVPASMGQPTVKVSKINVGGISA